MINRVNNIIRNFEIHQKLPKVDPSSFTYSCSFHTELLKIFKIYTKKFDDNPKNHKLKVFCIWIDLVIKNTFMKGVLNICPYLKLSPMYKDQCVNLSKLQKYYNNEYNKSI